MDEYLCMIVKKKKKRRKQEQKIRNECGYEL